MASRNKGRLTTNLQYWLFAVITVFVGFGLFYVSGTKWGKDHTSLGSLANQTGGLLIASVALATVWDLFARRALLREVLEVVQLKDAVVASGLESVGLNYNKAIDWDDRLASAREIDIFAAWATSWRNSHLAALTESAAQSGVRFRICIPDPQDNACVAALAARFSIGKAEVRARLQETIDAYKNLDGDSSSGRIEIYVTPVFRVFTGYRIDDTFIVTLYHHRDSRSGSVPTLVFSKGGAMYAWFQDDLEGVLSGNATRIYP